MARDVTTWVVVGGGLFLLTPTGQQLIDTVVTRVRELTNAASADPKIYKLESQGIPIPEHLDSYVPGEQNWRPTADYITQSSGYGPDAD